MYKRQIKGWYELERCYEKNEPIMGKITSKCKGGVIVEHIDTGSLMFCPGSQISDKPLKDISHLMNEPQKFALIKLDKIRGAGPPTSWGWGDQSFWKRLRIKKTNSFFR